MKKANKKGFTLVELLAVIVILAVLILIALPNVMNITTNAKKKAFINEAFAFIDAAEKQYTLGGYTGCKVFTYDATGNQRTSIPLSDQTETVEIDTMKYKKGYKAYVMVNPGQDSLIWIKKDNGNYIDKMSNTSNDINEVITNGDVRKKCSYNGSQADCSIKQSKESGLKQILESTCS